MTEAERLAAIKVLEKQKPQMHFVSSYPVAKESVDYYLSQGRPALEKLIPRGFASEIVFYLRTDKLVELDVNGYLFVADTALDAVLAASEKLSQ